MELDKYVSGLVAQKSRSPIRHCPEIVICHVANTSAAEAVSVCVFMFVYFCSFSYEKLQLCEGCLHATYC